MRAFAVQSFGKAPSIQDLPIPHDDEALLIKVKYAGVNPIDYKLVERLTGDSTYPFVLGADFSGVVEYVPVGDHGYQTGDRVFGMARTHGSYAQYTAVKPGVDSEPIAKIPDGVSDDQAAALPIPAITALGSLDLLGVKAGQSIVVIGATGGVGGYAVQMARARGAYVIATVRGNSEEASRLGAEEVYDSNAVDVINALHASHPDGVDAVLDLINGKDAIKRDAEIIKSGGSLVSTIYAADEAWFSERQITAQNIAGNSNRQSTHQGLNEVARMLADGTITARISSTVELDAAGEILEKLHSGGLHGKALIRI